jgi:hypothetical protein
MRYAAQLQDAPKGAPAPVHLWNPEHCGAIDIVIKGDGAWFYQGTPIRRARLARLFSTILKREGDDYFLVTPVEKLRIDVEDAPFTAVRMRAEGRAREQRLTFATNLGDEIAAGPEHAIVFRHQGENKPRAPYIHVRAGLEARIVRAVFYDLVELGETREVDGEPMFGVWSNGAFFSFAPADEVFE